MDDFDNILYDTEDDTTETDAEYAAISRARIRKTAERREKEKRRFRYTILSAIILVEVVLLSGYIYFRRDSFPLNRIHFPASSTQMEQTVPDSADISGDSAQNAPDAESLSGGSAEDTADVENLSGNGDALPEENSPSGAGNGGTGDSPPATMQFSLSETDATARIYAGSPENDNSIDSQYAVLIDAHTGEIIAARNSWAVISPASMTKVLTLLVAVEHLPDLSALNELVGVTKTVTDYCYRHGCSTAGFSTWETVTVRDLLYGCILPSGADAALALANYTAGSHENFVQLMNDKLEELGLSETAHFTNCIGLYDPDHHCTVKDIAIIMRTAMENPVCRTVLCARTFRTSATDEHPASETQPGGLLLSNWFLRRIEDRFTDSPIEVQGGKTGFVNQSGSCAVSYAHHQDGRDFICVTGNAPGSWRVIYDHTYLYQTYCG